MNRGLINLSASFALWFLCSVSVMAQQVPVPQNLWRLTSQEDTDGDHKITVHDSVTPFQLRGSENNPVETIQGVYHLSVLMQELKRAEDQHHANANLNQFRLDEPAADRTHRLIKAYYWDALTRRIDAAHVDEVIHDPKVASKFDYVYVPPSDPVAIKYFKQVESDANGQHRSPPLKVVVLPPPDKIIGQFARDLDGRHGILSLKLELDSKGNVIGGVPYVVPGGRFNELYCWDSYFIVLGLLQDGRKDLARGMVDNLIYEVNHYGKIPNANRTYYLTRSQPPFLTSMIRAVFDAGATDRDWLADALKTAMSEYENVWLGKERLVKIGPYELSRYWGDGIGPCPEVEPGHYDEKIMPWLSQVVSNDPDAPLTPYRFLNEYLYCGKYQDLAADGLTLNAFFKNDRAVRESGHDTTHRFDDRTADFATVDLNSLLYKYERDFAEILDTEFNGKLPSLGKELGDAAYWQKQAADRKKAMIALMWDDDRGYFFDYDFANKKRSTYISATGLYPLWASMLDTNNAADRDRVQRILKYATEKLLEPAGLAATAKESVENARRHDPRQWDYPFGWAPHQMLAWKGLSNYGLKETAGDWAYRWVYTIAKNVHDYNGTIPEKYNVVTGSHEVFVEYGNVGTKFSYIAPEGFGWMNASFEVGREYLSRKQMADLRELKPPPPRR